MLILSIDDSSTVRTMHKKILSRLYEGNVTFFEASNGQEGLDLLKKHPNINLILLDVNMPVMAGDEFLRVMRAEKIYNKIKVIMSTTEAEACTVRRLIKEGANGYIVKPFNLKKVEKALQVIFRRL